MSFNFSPKIVTDGLVLYLDAANIKSYTPDSLFWYDISKGSKNNGTLINGPVFNPSNGGNIIFDGINEWAHMWFYPEPSATSACGVHCVSYFTIGSSSWGGAYTSGGTGYLSVRCVKDY